MLADSGTLLREQSIEHMGWNHGAGMPAARQQKDSRRAGEPRRHRVEPIGSQSGDRHAGACAATGASATRASGVETLREHAVTCTCLEMFSTGASLVRPYPRMSLTRCSAQDPSYRAIDIPVADRRFPSDRLSALGWALALEVRHSTTHRKRSGDGRTEQVSL
jgi:hypothetical protein